ncbi:MAG TPA: dihydroxy-acid dehydratase [Marivita sp.]|nr:dihydroxy-acid dehydratase [Marivita sp.]
MIRLTALWVALSGAAFLTGCDAVEGGAALSFLDAGQDTNPALISAPLAGGDITVSGPEGYCIDATTLRSTNSGGFAALASCRILSGGEAGPIVEPGLLTVTVSRATGDAPTPAVLASALNTDLLREAELSSVNAGQMATGGESAFDGSDARHWRGAFVLGNRLIGLALYAPEGSPLVGAQGAAFLNTVSSRIRASSRAGEARADAPQSMTDPATRRLSRLFGTNDLQ